MWNFLYCLPTHHRDICKNSNTNAMILPDNLIDFAICLISWRHSTAPHHGAFNLPAIHVDISCRHLGARWRTSKWIKLSTSIPCGVAHSRSWLETVIPRWNYQSAITFSSRERKLNNEVAGLKIISTTSWMSKVGYPLTRIPFLRAFIVG